MFHDIDNRTNRDKIVAFYGKLLDFDNKFQRWEGKNHPNAKEIFQVTFNHNDVSRIVMQLGGGAGA